MGHRVFVGASAAATLPAALSAAVLVSAPFSGTAVSPLADARNQASTTIVADEGSTAPGPGASDWALLAMGEAVAVAGAAATVAMRRRALRPSRR